jgi:site-specific recombinase XerD
MTADLTLSAPDGYWLSVSPEHASRLSRLTAAWLARRSKATTDAYRKDLARWLAWCERCDVSPLSARMMHVDAWVAWQREYGPDGDGHPAAESSIGRRVAAISSWYKYLYRNTKDDAQPLVQTNPADTDGRPSLDPDYSPTIGLSTAEADRLCRAADDDGLRSSALIRLLLYGGIRCGSAIGANVEDLGRDRGYRVLTVRQKGGRTRRIPLPAALGEVIDAMLAARGDPSRGPLFATRNGGRLDRAYIRQLVQRLARNANIPSAGQLSPHSLRHTFATDYLDAGGNLRDLQDAMGHADPRTTRRYDRARHNLDRHPAHVLATRYGARSEG